MTISELSWAAVPACTLPTAERPLRVAEFDDLFASSLLTATRTAPTEAHLTFAGGEDLASRVRDLCARETACCSFFEFTVEAGPAGRVTLEVRVPATQAEVLESLVARAVEVRAAAGR